DVVHQQAPQQAAVAAAEGVRGTGTLETGPAGGRQGRVYSAAGRGCSEIPGACRTVTSRQGRQFGDAGNGIPFGVSSGRDGTQRNCHANVIHLKQCDAKMPPANPETVSGSDGKQAEELKDMTSKFTIPCVLTVFLLAADGAAAADVDVYGKANISVQ